MTRMRTVIASMLTACVVLLGACGSSTHTAAPTALAPTTPTVGATVPPTVPTTEAPTTIPPTTTTALPGIQAVMHRPHTIADCAEWSASVPFSEFEQCANAATDSGTQANTPTISLAEFDQLANGMSYSQAVGIIGGPGTVSADTNIAGIHTTIYMWAGEGSVGANANVTFQDGRLISKAQAGLD